MAAALGLAVLASGRVEASMLTLNMSGTFGPTATLGGTALGAGTPFMVAATFDSTSGIPYQNKTGVELFQTVATFTIAGFGTYTSVPGANVYVGLVDLSAGYGYYEAVLTNATGSVGFGGAYATATPSFSVLNPAPAVLSDLLFSSSFGTYTVPLQSGAGNLVLPVEGGFGAIEAYATITSTVPEPSTLALSATGLLVVCVASWCSRTKGVA